ncbi:hypothetical protein BKA62DRAFT_700595 [Auriculariales sp. MPI-PUGE-AT-0066]|nr:hypothetical protein BKA62DRAFT_700595 [Auriculariales sp. MPI-PUGE-AT-0066]
MLATSSDPQVDGIDQNSLVQALIRAELTLYYGLFAHVASVTLLWYDYILTFAWEKERIWSCRKGWFRTFWFLLRYPPLLLKSILLLGDYKHDWKLRSCQLYFVFGWLTGTLTLFVVHLTFLLRLYALYGRSAKVLAVPTLLLLANLVPVLMVAHEAGTDASAVPPNGICLPMFNITCVIASLALALAFDVVVLILVVARCIVLWRQQADNGVLTILIRDGLGYFGSITLLNVLNVIGIQERINPAVLQTFIMLAATLPTIIVCRMILNLRSVKQRSPRPESGRDSGIITYNDLTAPQQTILESIVDELYDVQTSSRYPLSWRRHRTGHS